MDDEEEFESMITGVTPLPPSKTIRPFPPTPHVILPTQHVTTTAPQKTHIPRGTLEHKAMRGLKAGRYPIDYSIDLHGLNRWQAYDYFTDTLHKCYERGTRSLCVIHGKGSYNTSRTGILRESVQEWAKASPLVLSFSFAPPEMGGDGATLILLRKERHRKK